MTWDPTQPPTNSALQSLPIRDNFGALDTALMAPVFGAATGALFYAGADVLVPLPPAANGTWLTLAGGVPTWSALPVDPGFANPLTTAGDILIGGASGAPARLAAVATGQVLVSQGVGTAPIWSPDPAIRNLLVNGGTVGTSGVGVLALGPGTRPTTSPVDTIQLTTYEWQPGAQMLYMRDERGGTVYLGTDANDGNMCQISSPDNSRAIRFHTAIPTETPYVGTVTNQSFAVRTNNTVRMTVETTNELYLAVDGVGPRRIGTGPPDSAGFGGYRMLVIPNS